MMYLWLAWMWMFVPLPEPGNTRAFEDQHTRWDLDNMIYFCPRHEREVKEILESKEMV